MESVKYWVELLDNRKRVALMKYEDGVRRAIAYFRDPNEAEEFSKELKLLQEHRTALYTYQLLTAIGGEKEDDNAN